MKTHKSPDKNILKTAEVLIVDDYPDNLNVISTILYSVGINPTFANNGKEALEAIGVKLPDLILLDIAMPGIDGYEVCQILKSKEETRSIPVIFLSAKNDTENIVKGFEVGGVDYITKPFNHKELISRVKTQLRLKLSKELIAEQNKQITEQNKQITKQNTQLKELNATKDKFFSIIAHDLRNPFQVLKELTSHIVENFQAITTDELYSLLVLLRDTSNSGYDLLENLLVWSKSQRSTLKPEPVFLELYSFIEEQLNLLRPTASKKEIVIKNTINQKLTAHFDVNILQTIIRNLVSNAIKFTPQKGKITISATKNNKITKITVSDTGIGIAEKDLKKLFRIDVNHSTPGTNAEEGTGLGLILCKEFADKCGGDITVKSKVGKGSDFTFSLPVCEKKR